MRRMLTGTINADGSPAVELLIGGQFWSATIDTGFNGDLELPDALRLALNPVLTGQTTYLLGGGRPLSWMSTR
jgi:hypothetical protein